MTESSSNPITRRAFVRLTVQAAGAVECVVAGCELIAFKVNSDA